jgi:hypothetical protein
VVIIHYGGNFCRPDVRSVRIPIPRLSPFVTASGIGGIYLVTDWIWGTSPGSSKAYAAPLKVVPISRATTSFREGPEYGARSISMVGVKERRQKPGAWGPLRFPLQDRGGRPSYPLSANKMCYLDPRVWFRVFARDKGTP